MEEFFFSMVYAHPFTTWLLGLIFIGFTFAKLGDFFEFEETNFRQWVFFTQSMLIVFYTISFALLYGEEHGWSSVLDFVSGVWRVITPPMCIIGGLIAVSYVVRLWNFLEIFISKGNKSKDDE